MSNKHHDPARRQFLEQMTLAAGVAGVSGLVAQNVMAAQPAAPTAEQTAAAATQASSIVTGPPPLRDVAGKVAFITGGSSGIGLGQARVFHEAGMKVVIGYIRDDQVGPALDQFKTGKDRVHAIKVNVIDRVAMAAAADEIEAKFGKIHLISNNAGIGLCRHCLDRPADFDQTVAVNLTGVCHNGVHIFLPRPQAWRRWPLPPRFHERILPTEGGGAGAYTCRSPRWAWKSCVPNWTANANVGVSVYARPTPTSRAGEERERRLAEPGAKAAPPDAPANEAYVRQIIGNGMDPMEAAVVLAASATTTCGYCRIRNSIPTQGALDAPGINPQYQGVPENRLAQEITTMQ
jgi:hypothetical protein